MFGIMSTTKCNSSCENMEIGQISDVPVKEMQNMGALPLKNLELKTENTPDKCFIKKELNAEEYESLEDLNATHEHTGSLKMGRASSKRLFNCLICNYKPSCKCDYQSHVAGHADPLDKTMFKCLFCDYRVRTLLSLREHMFVHEDLSQEFKCFVCNVFCKSESDFNDHIWLHKGLDSQHVYECIYCDHKALSVNTMKMHMLTHKDSIAVQQCCLCHYKSKNRGDLLRHFVTHKESPNLDIFKCHLCGYKTKQLSSLKVHLSNHIDNIELLKCCVCDYKCRTKDDLAKHFLIHKDSSSLDLLKCSFCTYSTSNLGDLRLHLLKHNTSLDNSKFCVCHLQNQKDISAKLFDCTTDRKSFTNASSLKAHTSLPWNPKEKSISSNPEGSSQKKLFKCTTCHKTFTTKSYLRKHYLLHMDPEARPTFSCGRCEYKTFTHDRLRQHQRIHQANTQQHQCPMCDAKYSYKYNLTEHISVCHTDPKYQLRYHCDSCEFVANTRDKLRRHKKKHVAKDNLGKEEEKKLKIEQEDSSTPAKYQCDRCSFCTDLLQSLEYHKETHKDRSERQLFSCLNCSKTFTAKSHLTKHSVLHVDPEKQPTYHCELCDFKSLYKMSCRKHIKLKHPEMAEELLEKPKVNTKNVIHRCKECSYESRYLSKLRLHEETHKDRSERDHFQCASCNYKFMTKNALREHILHNHTDLSNLLVKRESSPNETPEARRNSDIFMSPKYRCDECSYLTTLSNCFKSHLETHKHSSVRKQFICTICNNALKTRTGLKVHSLVHMDPKDRPVFRCEFCDFETVYKPTLRKHSRLKHPEATEKKFGTTILKPNGKRGSTIHTCKECSYQTKSRYCLRRHEDTHKDRSERNLYECATCGSKYTTKVSLQEHIAQHHVFPKAPPKYQCYDCEFSTVSKREITAHRLEHIYERPCNISVVQESNVMDESEQTTEVVDPEHVWIKDEIDSS